MSNGNADAEMPKLVGLIEETPDASYSDIGGLDDVIERIRQLVEYPIVHGDVLEAVGVEAPSGIILHGPPGTGKTLVAKAVANESGSSFISIKGPEIYHKYVGVSEKGIRDVFEIARENEPAVVFFDEIDALAPQRGSNEDAGVSDRVVSQLLTELDGFDERGRVVVIAATNRLDLVDEALLRPGRIDRSVRVSMPGREAREEILKVHMRPLSIDDDVDAEWIADNTERFSGADIAALCREAGMLAVVDVIEHDAEPFVTQDHFERAIEEVRD